MVRGGVVGSIVGGEGRGGREHWCVSRSGFTNSASYHSVLLLSHDQCGPMRLQAVVQVTIL